MLRNYLSNTSTKTHLVCLNTILPKETTTKKQIFALFLLKHILPDRLQDQEGNNKIIPGASMKERAGNYRTLRHVSNNRQRHAIKDVE